MSRQARQTADLALLTATVLAARQAEMAALKAEDAALVALLSTLDSALSSRLSATTALREADPAQLAGADPRWQGWIAARKQTINMERARLRAAQDIAHNRLTQAFGRNRIAETLHKSAREADMAARARRAD
ncbi:MAG: hypothetical protein GC146_08980 [Limimaricola sp.]|uniref:hypothetical protein n=1 Tax=Limimaricola sp. TaxID=2211665 RepID=UPI001D23363E|nr:hypothetical protein [Limimaricola sp.]MBI1417342.1 hypothetical protein [Limimaricola sp.]